MFSHTKILSKETKSEKKKKERKKPKVEQKADIIAVEY